MLIKTRSFEFDIHFDELYVRIGRRDMYWQKGERLILSRVPD